jgi:hypothetical protein
LATLLAHRLFRRLDGQPFRAHQAMDHAAAMQTWEMIAHAMDEIYNRNASQLSFEELYRAGYNLVLHKHGHLLYDGVSFKISSQLQQQQQQVLQNLSENGEPSNDAPASSAGTSTPLLQDMARCWKVSCALDSISIWGLTHQGTSLTADRNIKSQ